MTSSISSFKTEWKVVAFVVATLLAVELAIRWKEPTLSKDVAHIREMPAIAQKIDESKDQPSMLFLGNSLIRYGVDENVFQAELKEKGVPTMNLVKAHPDASSLTEWYYCLNTFFLRPNHVPKVLVVGFAFNHLEDQRHSQVERLGAYCGNLGDVFEILERDTNDFESRMGFLLSTSSSAYAQKDRVRGRVLDTFIPNYRDAAQITNSRLKKPKAPAEGAEVAAKSYGRLERMMDLAEKHRVQLVLVAMPVQAEYPIDPKLEELVDTRGARLVDMRDVTGLQRPEHFVDDIHMSPDGAKVFSRSLAEKMVEAGKEPFIARPATKESTLISANLR